MLSNLCDKNKAIHYFNKIGVSSFLFFSFNLLIASSLFSDVYVGAYGGGIYGFSRFHTMNVKNIYQVKELNAEFSHFENKNISNHFNAGLQLAYWFSHEYPQTQTNYKVTKKPFSFEEKRNSVASISEENPSSWQWKEHFGFYLDYNYQPLDLNHVYHNVRVKYTDKTLPINFPSAYGNCDLYVGYKGYAQTISFLFACRHGHFPLPRVPMGRLQSFLAIGPAVVLVKDKVQLTIGPHTANNTSNNFTVIQDVGQIVKFKQHNIKACPCFALNYGLRFQFFENFAADLFMNYRYFPAKLKVKENLSDLTFESHYNLFESNLALSYIF